MSSEEFNERVKKYFKVIEEIEYIVEAESIHEAISKFENSNIYCESSVHGYELSASCLQNYGIVERTE